MEELSAPPEEKLLRAPTFFEKNGKRILLFLPILFILVLLIGYSLAAKQTKPDGATQIIAPTKAIPSTLPGPTTEPNVNWKTYTDKNLGISFGYDDGAYIQKDGNKICVSQYLNTPTPNPTGYLNSNSSCWGEYVEIFTKKPDQTLKDAITEQIMLGHSSRNCFVFDYTKDQYQFELFQQYEQQDGDFYAQIDAPGETDYKCPYDYVVSNGPRFFMMDKNFPDKFAFFGSGYNVPSIANHSFKFLDQTTTQIIPLSSVWQMGTITYINPKLGISFEYPKVFTVNVEDVSASPYKESQVTFSMRINSPDIQSEQKDNPEFDWTAYNENTMAIDVIQSDNISNQTLYAFLTEADGRTGVDGKTLIVDLLKKGLTSSSVPIPGSYVFKGTLGENPSKDYYFKNKDKTYSITLWGGNNAADMYSNDAEKIFDQIISSIKFTQ